MKNNIETDKNSLKSLLNLEDELKSHIEKLSADLSKSHSRDSGEQAVERENDEVIDQLERDASEELTQVQNAIQRIESGKYHLCSSCGGDISAARLKAIPYTTLCITCADTSSTA